MLGPKHGMWSTLFDKVPKECLVPPDNRLKAIDGAVDLPGIRQDLAPLAQPPVRDPRARKV